MTLKLDKIDLNSLVVEDRVEDPLQSTMTEAMKVDTASEVKIKKLSRDSGMPMDAVRTDPASVETSLNLNKIDFKEMSKRNPNTSKYLTDYNNASIAHDDHEILTKLEDTVAIVPAGVAQATLGASEMIFGTPRAADRMVGAVAKSIEDLTGLPRNLNPIRGIQDIAGFISEGRLPGDIDLGLAGTTEVAGMIKDATKQLTEHPEIFPEAFSRLALKGQEADAAFNDALKGDFVKFGDVMTDPEAWAGFLAQAAPSLMLAYASGGSMPFMAWMEGMEAANSAAEFEETTGQKMSDAQFMQATTQAGLINAQLEKIGFDKIFGATGKGLSGIINATVTEPVTEMAQTLNTNIAEYIAFNKEKDVREGILGAGMGGLGAGFTVSTASVAVDSMTTKTQRNQIQGSAEQTTIDKINDSAEKSKLKKNDKESFREFMQGVNDDSDVFIDGAQTKLYLQTKTDEEIQGDPALLLLQKKVDEAAALGGDVTVPVADFATDVTGTEHYEALREHMKLSPETSTTFRKEQEQTEAKNYVETLMSKAQEDVSTYVESQDIFNTVKDQLVDTGRMTPQQATTMASVVPAWAAVQAQDRGIPVSQVYQESGLKIEGPLTGEAARLSAEALEQRTEQTLEQGIVKSDVSNEVYDIVVESTGTGPFDGGCVVCAQAIQKTIGGDIVGLVREDGVVDHAAVRKGDLIYDFDGAQSEQEFIKDFNIKEKSNIVDIRELKNDDLPDAQRDDKASSQIAELISRQTQTFAQKEMLDKVEQSDIFNIEEAKRRINDGIYIHDRVPEEVLRNVDQKDFRDAYAVARRSLRSVRRDDGAGFPISKSVNGRHEEAQSIRKAEAEFLRHWAKQNDKMIPDFEQKLTDYAKERGTTKFQGGNENYVYLDKNNKKWFKANNFRYTPTFSDLFDRIALHNYYFPETAYTLEGFADVKGEFLPIISQRHFKNDTTLSKAAREKIAAKRIKMLGFEKKVVEGYGETPRWVKGDVVMHDVDANNIAIFDGVAYVFDPVVYLNTNSKAMRVIGEDIQVDTADIATGIEDIGLEDIPGVDVFMQEAKGYYDPANSMIRLTESSDLSTFLHEFAHFMYDMEVTNADSKKIESIHNWFRRNADDVANEANSYIGKEGALEQPEIPTGVGNITAADVAAYLDTKTSGDVAKDKAIERAVHEQFARGFETYLMEGKAPSIEMRNVFRSFARWLTQIYQNVKGDLQVNLDDEMRAVFASMIATEEQIAAAAARAQLEPMFTDAAMAGKTEEEWEKYQERQAQVKDKSTETLRDKLIKQLTRRTKTWWKEEKSDIVDDEIEKLKKEKVYLAKEALITGDFKLDRLTVKDMVGEERTDRLGRTTVRIPETLNKMTAPGGEGVHPDEAAGFLGYNTGSELIKDLIDAPAIKIKAEENAEVEMIERHGDIMNDGTIEKEADDAIQNEERGKLILDELKTLSKKTGRAVVERQMLKTMAEENIGKLSFRNIHPGKYRKAELRAAQEAAAAFATGDMDTATSAKAKQALNFYLGKAATEAKNDTMKIVDRMARYKKKSVREAVMRAEGGYWEQLTKILNRFEFRKGATLGQVDRLNENINVWAKARIEEDGDGLVLTPEVLDEGYVTHWKNVPYDALVGVNDSVKNIEHVARYSNKMTSQQEEIDFKKLVQKWTTSMDEKVKTKFKTQRTDVIEGKNWGRWAMAQMTKIPYMASWLDGQERVGMSHDILVQPFTDAYNEELRLWDEVGSVVMKAIEGRNKADRKRHNKKIFIPEIKDADNDGNLYGHQIISVALNTGNESNLKKLLLGEGWANPDIEADISIENQKLQAVLKHMNKADWEMVQLIWDQMEQLYPKLAEVHRKTTGLTPPKIDATPIETGFGTFKGGYYPVKYDSNRSFKAQQNEDRLNAETESMFGKVGVQASVNASATNERTGYYAPIRLSLDVVPAHFQETIHYITHHDAVRETNKLIKNESVAAMIKEKLGPEEYAQLKPWLNDIAKDGREAPLKTFIGSTLQRLRFGTTLGVMGFKASTGIIQTLGIANTIAEVGSAPVYQSIRSILGSTNAMQDSWDFAVDNSKVMKHRVKTMDREIKNAMQKIEGKRGILAAAQEASMKHIAMVQTYMVDLPSWHAAYIKGMKDWGDEKRAYAYADWVIENIQGSGITKDMAQIMRNQSQEMRIFTMFMTFFSSLWNQERDIVKGSRAGTYSRSTVAAKMMFIFTIPVLLEMLLRGDFGDDDDDESNLQKYLTNLALYPVQSIPGLRDIATGTAGEYGYNISPVAQILEAGTASMSKVAGRLFTDDELTKSQVKGATKFVGALVGIPGINQAWSTGEHLHSVLSEGEELTLSQLLYGPRR